MSTKNDYNKPSTSIADSESEKEPGNVRNNPAYFDNSRYNMRPDGNNSNGCGPKQPFTL